MLSTVMRIGTDMWCCLGSKPKNVENVKKREKQFSKYSPIRRGSLLYACTYV